MVHQDLIILHGDNNNISQNNLQDILMGFVTIVSSLDIMLGIALLKDLVLRILVLTLSDPLKEEEGEVDHLETLQEEHPFPQEGEEEEEEDTDNCVYESITVAWTFLSNKLIINE